MDFLSDVLFAGRSIPRQLQDCPDDLTRLSENVEQDHPVWFDSPWGVDVHRGRYQDIAVGASHLLAERSRLDWTKLLLWQKCIAENLQG